MEKKESGVPSPAANLKEEGKIAWVKKIETKNSGNFGDGERASKGKESPSQVRRQGNALGAKQKKGSPISTVYGIEPDKPLGSASKKGGS